MFTSKKISKQKQIMSGGGKPGKPGRISKFKTKRKLKSNYKKLKKSTDVDNDGKTYNNLKKNYKKSKVGRLRRLTGRATIQERFNSGVAKAKMLASKADLKKKAITNYLVKKRDIQKEAQLKVITSKFSKSPFEMLSKIEDPDVKDAIKKPFLQIVIFQKY